MGRLDGKVAFITGAARGQGRSHCVRLAQEGADIIAVDLCAEIGGMPYPAATSADLKETVSAVSALDRRIISAEVDTRDIESMASFLKGAVADLGRLDVISANAGIGSLPRRAWEIEGETWQQMFDVTVTGTWNTCRAAIPHLLAGGRGGSIVITSSAASVKGYANIGHYVSAKHALVGLMRTLAIELGPESVRVNCIAPSQVPTDMILNDLTFRLFAPDKDTPTREDFAAASQGMHLLPTPWVEPIDVSNALLFLVSDEARFITGITLPVDAGATQY
jgi:(+)-trans-carveol dehydrogenase